MHSEYIRETNSDTAVLFIHGILGTPRHFDEFIPLLPQEWSVFNILLTGHGGTTEEFACSSMKLWLSKAEQTMKYLAARYKKVIIVAHSMGALFAARLALRYPQIKLLFLLAPPLSISLKPSAVTNSAKVLFGLVRPYDFPAVAARDRYSITPDPRLWRYISWLPRYMELSRLSYRSRKVFSRLHTPCCIVLSAKDELVSSRSLSYLKNCRSARIMQMKRSGHFYYEKRDNEMLLKYFSRLMQKIYRNQ